MYKVGLNILLCLILVHTSLLGKEKQWDISDFGAKGDSITLNTEAIQKAIDTCHKAGGGVVYIKNGIYKSGTILLKDNVKLHIAKGAKLIGSESPLDFKSIDPFVDATGQTRGKCLVGALNVKNVGIYGEGTIDGRGKLFKYKEIKQTMSDLNIPEKDRKALMGDRPFLIRFVKTENIELKNIHLRQPAAWTVHFYQCKGILVDGISIYSHAHRNNDGIDLDSSSDVIIKNSDINSGDDAMCFKATSPKATHHVKVSNCVFKSDWGAIKFGTEAMGDFHDIHIKNCKVRDTRGGGIKMLSVDGSNISNIVIENIEMEDVDMPLFVRLGERLRTYRNAPKQSVGSIKNVTIKNIKATTRALDKSRVSPPSGIFITGTPNHLIDNFTLKNIEVKLPGKGTKEQIQLQVEEQIKKYPEFSFFGVLPAYGLYGRHIKNLSVQHLNIITEAKDERKAVLLEDVKQHSLKGLKINGSKVNKINTSRKLKDDKDI